MKEENYDLLNEIAECRHKYNLSSDIMAKIKKQLKSQTSPFDESDFQEKYQWYKYTGKIGFNGSFCQDLSDDKFVIIKPVLYKSAINKNLHGITYGIYYYGREYIIYPFKIVEHNWDLKAAGAGCGIYQCKNCKSTGKKAYGPNNIISAENPFLTCQEITIKSII